MALDVIQKAITANVLRNIRAVHADQTGHISSLDRNPGKSQPVLEAVEQKYTDKFDDTNYYQN